MKWRRVTKTVEIQLHAQTLIHITHDLRIAMRFSVRVPFNHIILIISALKCAKMIVSHFYVMLSCVLTLFQSPTIFKPEKSVILFKVMLRFCVCVANIWGNTSQSEEGS